MAGSVDKKKNEIKAELEGSPATHADARSAILADVTLSREFAATYLNALCEGFTGGKNESGVTTTMSLNTVCRTLEKQRRLCYGARSIASGTWFDGDESRFFSLPNYGTVNGALGLTEPGPSTMGIKAKDIAETYTVNLSTTAGTQTQGSNTFSVHIDDYYLVRSRVSGELEPISANLSAYTTPDGGDIVFGNTIAWGSPVAGEQEANTWNYHWAKVNLTDVATTFSGNFKEITTLTFDTLTAGSDGVTPVGGSFGNKFYLKRKADYVNTFTITGISTAGTVEITGVSDADLTKVKYGDVISGTGLPDDNVSIAAVQTADSKIRLNETGIVTTSGAITLTVNSVPFGYQAHDIFCQVEVVAEGLVTNDNWKPIGDGIGGYGGANEGSDELLVASTTEFKGLLEFFNPSSPNNDLTRGASSTLTSEGKEYSGTLYPDIETNPLKPSNQGTTKARATKAGEFTGTQPDNFGDKDVWVGRFVAWNKDRTLYVPGSAPGVTPVVEGVTVPVGEYRYVLDNAERFFYAPSRNAAYTGGSITVAADPYDPAYILADRTRAGFEQEPRAVLPRTTLSPATAGAASTTSIAIPAIGAIGPITANKGPTSIPVDENTSPYSGSNTGGYRITGSTYWSNNPTLPKEYSWISGQSPPTQTGATDYGQHVARSFYTVSGNYIIRNEIYYSSGTVPGTPLTASSSWSYGVSVRQVVADVTHNFYQRFMGFDPDVVFLGLTVDDLQASVKFRDPGVTETTVIAPRELPAGTGSTGTGISDLAFDNYILTTVDGNGDTAWEATIAAMNVRLGEVRAALSLQITNGRAGNNNGGNNLGTEITITNPNMTTAFATFTSENATLLSNCNKRVAEVDARIGKPFYGGGAASTRGTAPSIYVEDIPSTGATGQTAYDAGFTMIPYGRSIYNNVNHLLGQDVDLLGGIVKDIESLTDLIGMVETARNKYNIFSGNDKAY